MSHVHTILTAAMLAQEPHVHVLEHELGRLKAGGVRHLWLGTRRVSSTNVGCPAHLEEMSYCKSLWGRPPPERVPGRRLSGGGQTSCRRAQSRAAGSPPRVA